MQINLASKINFKIWILEVNSEAIKENKRNEKNT